MEDSAERRPWIKILGIFVAAAALVAAFGFVTFYAVVAYNAVPFRDAGSTILGPAAISKASGHMYQVHYAMTDSDLAKLVDHAQTQPELRSLWFWDCSRLTDDGVKRVVRLNQLKNIGFEKARHLGDVTAATLASMPNLRSIQLDGSDTLTDAGVLTLSARPLESISLSESAITDSALTSLSRNSNLVEIVVHRCGNLSAIGLMELTKLPKLRSLNVSYCPNIGAQSIVDLLRNTSLEWLDADGLELSDEVLGEARGHKMLTHLGIENAKGISKAAIEELRRARPDMVLDH